MKKLWALLVLICAVHFGEGISGAMIMAVTDEATWQSTAGAWTTAGFEGFLGPVTTQFAGVAFFGFNGGSPYTTAIFPHEGQNSMFTVQPWNAGGGGWAAVFDEPVQSFAFWAGDVEFSNSTITILDSANALLGSYELMASGGGHGPFLYGFNGFVSDSLAIARVELAINAADAIWFDKFQYSSAAQTPITEPSSIWLLSSALAAVVPLRRLRRR